MSNEEGGNKPTRDEITIVCPNELEIERYSNECATQRDDSDETEGSR